MKFILVLLFNILLSDVNLENDLELWNQMHQKFTIDLARDFSNRDVDAWLNYFAPNTKINIYQYGDDVSGNTGKGKTIKVYSGNFFSSMIRGRFPASLMAKTVFKKLSKQDYKKSNIQLLGILKDKGNIKVYVRFERINELEEVYQTARSVYTLIRIGEDWFINAISTYDDSESINERVNYNQMYKK